MSPDSGLLVCDST